MATTTAYTPNSMKPHTQRGRTERRILVAGKWQRTPQQQSLMAVFGRDAAFQISEASVKRYNEATSLRALLA